MEIGDQRTPDEPHCKVALGFTHMNVMHDEKGHQPRLVSALNSLGGSTLVEVSRLNGAGHLMHGGLEAVLKRMLAEHIDAQLVQEGGQGDARIVRHVVTQGERPERRQFADEPFRQRPDAIFFFGFSLRRRRSGRADGNDARLTTCCNTASRQPWAIERTRYRRSKRRGCMA